MNIGDTVYQGVRRGKVIGHVGPSREGSVIPLPEMTQRPNYEVEAHLVIFAGQRGPIKVPKGELSRVMAMPVRVKSITR